MKRILTILGVSLPLCFAAPSRAQLAGELSTDNGFDSNPNQSPQQSPDVIGSHTLDVADTLRAGPGFFLPEYFFNYNSFARRSGQNFYSHNFILAWTQPDFFMPAAVAQARKSQELEDSTEGEERGDSNKDGLCAHLTAIANFLLNADFADSASDDSPSVNSAADTTATDSTEAESEGDTTTADEAETDPETPRDSLKDNLAIALDDISDSLNNADGADSLKTAIAAGVRNFEHNLTEAFPGQPFVAQTNDSLAVFLAELRRYIPPPIDTAEEVEKSEEDMTIYEPLSVPRFSMYDFTQSDLTLETSGDDTANYEFTLSGTLTDLVDLSPGDTLGSLVYGASAQLNQSPSGAFNIYERAQIISSSYTALDTLNNTEYLVSTQGRWQPGGRFMALFELGFGIKDYAVQEQDTVTHPITKKMSVAKSATVASQFSVGLGFFWRIFRPTAIGATFYYLNNPSNVARIVTNIYLNRRHGFNNLFNDRFTYNGPDWRLYIKQYLFDSVELGLNYEAAALAYNQGAYSMGMGKNGKLALTPYQQRKDRQTMLELQLTRTFDVDFLVFTEFTPELLIGELRNTSNDPTFNFREGYAMLNLSLEF